MKAKFQPIPSTINVAQKYKVNSYFGGISVNWSIFDGLAAGAAERNALARRRQVENDYRSLTEQLAQQAQTQVKQINFSARSKWARRHSWRSGGVSEPILSIAWS